MHYSFFCTCPRGLEVVLSDEINEIAVLSTSLKVHNVVQSGVHCSGFLEDAWLINLHSRIASRVLLRMGHSSYQSENDIYDLALAQRWDDWFLPEHTIRVDVTAIKSPLKSLEFITLKVKDGLCDRFRERFGRRPSVNTTNPDIRIVAFFDKHNATLYLDTSGEALFKRGWRQETGDAPLRENLAAGLLRVANWTPEQILFDPMCGSGTILAEAAQVLCGIPPGIRRTFAFEKFNGFAKERWLSLKENFIPRAFPAAPLLFGSDISGDMLVMARRNLESAGIHFDIPLKQIEAQNIKSPSDTPGILLTNPPYGERIGVRGDASLPVDDLAALFYREFSRNLKQKFSGWKVFLFTADLSVPKMLRLKESRKTVFYNGALECRLFRFDMVAGSNRDINSSLTL